MKALKITLAALVTILTMASCQKEHIMPNNELKPTTEFVVNENYNTLNPRDPDVIINKHNTDQALENKAIKIEEATSTADRRSFNK